MLNDSIHLINEHLESLKKGYEIAKCNFLQKSPAFHMSRNRLSAYAEVTKNLLQYANDIGGAVKNGTCHL